MAAAGAVQSIVSPAAAPPPPRGRALTPAAARRRAEDEARSAFLRTVSHEMRTPLNTIIGFSEVISGEMLGPIGEPRYREYADTVRCSGLRMLELVNDVLEVARLEAGAADLHLAPEPVATAFADVIRAFELRAAQRAVRLACDVLPADLLAIVDSRALQEVLKRILQNAIAFSPECGAVRLSARREGRIVRIEIEDEGSGVRRCDVYRLLRPFQRGAPAPGAPEGAGLGLAVADLLTKAMGGRLRLVTAPGRGLLVSLRLPAA